MRKEIGNGIDIELFCFVVVRNDDVSFGYDVFRVNGFVCGGYLVFCIEVMLI